MSDSQTPQVTQKPPGLFAQLQGLDTRFWIVNIMEMFERLAYYGVRAVIAIYMVLPREKGGPQFTHTEKGLIFAWWAGLQSFLPMFTGGYADRYGHKLTIAFAIILKVIGYVMMAKFMNFWGFFAGCMFLATGTAIFKPGVQGTLAATLKSSNASMGWGVFYQLVNVGGFLGPVVAGILRLMDWEYVFYACAVIVSINFLWLPFYKDPSKDYVHSPDMDHPIRVFLTSIKGIFRPRILFFCLVFSGFWLMFNQVFDLLPNFIDDWVDSSGIIATVGKSFSNATFPTVLALALALLYGGVCAVGVLLALRPDHRALKTLNFPPFIVVAIALTGSFYFSFKAIDPALAYIIAPAAALLLAAAIFEGIHLAGNIVLSVVFFIAIRSTLLALQTTTSMHFTSMATTFMTILLVGILLALLSIEKASAKAIAWIAFIPAALGSFWTMRANFISNADVLTKLAKQHAQVPPEWMLNINPGLIVFTMVFFAYLTSFMRPLTSIIVGMLIATAGSVFAGTTTFGWFCLFGIMIFSVGEMLSSPKKMEYLATLSPKGQEGLYMGYANVPVAIGWIAGSLFAGTTYERMGDKVNLAKQHLESVIGMSKEAIALLPKSEVVSTLAHKLNMTVVQTQQLLYDTYQPQRIWLHFDFNFSNGLSGLFSSLSIGTIGLLSIIGMVIYDRVIHALDQKKTTT